MSSIKPPSRSISPFTKPLFPHKIHPNPTKKAALAQKNDPFFKKSPSQAKSPLSYLSNNPNSSKPPSFHQKNDSNQVITPIKAEKIIHQMKEEKSRFLSALSRLSNFEPTPPRTYKNDNFLVLSQLEESTLQSLISQLQQEKEALIIQIQNQKKLYENEIAQMDGFEKGNLIVTEGVRQYLGSLKQENEILEEKIGDAQKTLGELRRNEEETRKLLEGFQEELKKMEENEGVIRKETSQMQVLVEFEVEKNKKMEGKLSQEFMENEISYGNIKKLKEDIEGLDIQIEKWKQKKKSLLTEQENLQIKSQEAHLSAQNELDIRSRELDQLKRELNQFLNQTNDEKQILSSEIEVIQSKIASFTSESYQLEEQSRKDLAKLEDELQIIQISNEDALALHSKAMRELENEHQELGQKKNELDTRIDELMVIKENVQNDQRSNLALFERRRTEIEMKMNKLMEENRGLEEEISELKKVGNEKRTRANSSFQPNQDNTLQSDLNSLLQDIDQLEHESSELQLQKEKLAAEIFRLEDKIKEEKRKKEEIEKDELDKINKGHSKMELELEELKKVYDQNDSLYQNMNQEKSKMEKELEEVEKSIELFQKQMEENLERINLYTEKESELNEKLKGMETNIKK